MDDKKLQEQITEYAQLGQQNPNVDVASLMLNALSNKGNMVSSKQKKWAYIISAGLPPFGLLFVLKFYLFSNEDDAKTVGHGCLILTILSVAAFWIFGKLLFSSSGADINQIQQINPQMIQNTLGG